jgi:hypothetical protein
MRTKLSNVIVGSDQEDLAVGHYAPQKWLAGSELGGELGGRIHVGVDLPPQRFLRRRHRADHFRERDVADDHDIEIAAGALVAARDRPVDECRANAPRQGFQRSAQHVGDARGLLEDVTQVFVDRASSVRLKLDQIANRLSQQDASVGQAIQFPEQGARGLSGHPRNLAHVQRDVRVQQEQREGVAAVGAEQQVGEIRCHEERR